MSQFTHTSWTPKEGIPGPVRAIAQTKDGYLWLAAEAGLYRFDGIRFVAWKPREGERVARLCGYVALLGYTEACGSDFETVRLVDLATVICKISYRLQALLAGKSFRWQTEMVCSGSGTVCIRPNREWRVAQSRSRRRLCRTSCAVGDRRSVAKCVGGDRWLQFCVYVRYAPAQYCSGSPQGRTSFRRQPVWP